MKIRYTTITHVNGVKIGSKFKISGTIYERGRDNWFFDGDPKNVVIEKAESVDKRFLTGDLKAYTI